MKFGFYHKEGRMQQVWDLLKVNHQVELIDEKVSDYDVLLFGMHKMDESLYCEAFWESLDESVVCIGSSGSGWLKHHFRVFCLLDNEYFLLENAKITSWGILGMLLVNSEYCLSDEMIDVIGYGRCGQALVELLQMLEIPYRVICKERCDVGVSYKEYLMMVSSRWIVQTAEDCFFDEYWLSINGKDAKIIDITTGFVGTKDVRDVCDSIYYAKGLPDVYCVKSAGNLYYDVVMEYIS